MPKPYSQDLRDRVFDAVREGAMSRHPNQFSSNPKPSPSHPAACFRARVHSRRSDAATRRQASLQITMVDFEASSYCDLSRVGAAQSCACPV
jgi:hypothetical protein